MEKTQITEINLNLFKFTRKTCIKILLIVCLFLLLGKTAMAPLNGTKFDWEQYKANEYKFATEQLVIQVDEYIKKYAEDSKLSAKRIVEICDEYDLDIKLVLAQGHLESHFGTKGLATETNSVFNVGTYDDGTILFRYKNPNQSIEPYVQLLKTRYLTEDKTEDELLQKNQFRDINGKRYASSRAYEQRLSDIISIVSQTTDIDSLISVRKKYGVIKPIEEIQFNLLITNNINNDTGQREIQQGNGFYFERWFAESSEIPRN